MLCLSLKWVRLSMTEISLHSEINKMIKNRDLKGLETLGKLGYKYRSYIAYSWMSHLMLDNIWIIVTRYY